MLELHLHQRIKLYTVLVVISLFVVPARIGKGSVAAELTQDSIGHDRVMTAMDDTWLVTDYASSIRDLYSVFNYFNLSKYGGGWQVEVWDNFSDYAWSQGKKAYFDAQCIIGLVEAWNFTGNASYLQYAQDIWEWDRAHCWDMVYGGYYERLAADNIVEIGNKRLWFQCLTGVALAKLYSATGNSSYLSYIDELFRFIDDVFFDPAYGSYYSALSSTLVVIEESNDINDIFWCTRFLIEAFRTSGNMTYRQRAIELIDRFLTNMYDQEYGWFFNRVSHDWTSVVKDSKGWYDNLRLLVDAYQVLGNLTYLDYAKKCFNDIQQANSSAGYLMQMNREWTSYVNNELLGEEDPNVAISYLKLGWILGNETILGEAIRFKDAIYDGLHDSAYGGLFMRLKADGTVHTWKQWLAQGLIMEMLSVFGSSFSWADLAIPTISSTTHEPVSPTDTDVVTFRTIVSDLSGVLYVNLSLSVNTGPWSNHTMSNLTDTLYESYLGGFTAGDHITYYIVAADASPNRNIGVDDNDGSYYSFDVGSNDWIGPGIAAIVHRPLQPTPSDTVIINATITDLSGIHSATLYYRIDGGSWLGVSMARVTQNTYQASLEHLPDNALVEYFITATDNSLNRNVATSDNGGTFYSFRVESSDLFGPDITEVSQVPVDPTSQDSVTVEATVDDPSNVTAVILSYVVDDSTMWTNVSMILANNRWGAVIPPTTAGSIIHYRVYASDSKGNWAVSPIWSYVVKAAGNDEPVDYVSTLVLVSSLVVTVTGLAVIAVELGRRRAMTDLP